MNIRSNFDKQRSLYKSIVEKTHVDPKIASSQAVNLQKARFGQQFAPSSPSKVSNIKSVRSANRLKVKSPARVEIKQIGANFKFYDSKDPSSPVSNSVSN